MTTILRADFDYHFIALRWWSSSCFLDIRNGSPTRRRHSSPTSGKGPLISWMYPVFGVRGATYFLGVAEWLFGGLLFLGFWNRKLGILGALGSCFFVCCNHHHHPIHTNGWAASAGGFPAMTETVAFLLKDLVLLAVSVYLLRQDVLRVSQSTKESSPASRRSTSDRGFLTTRTLRSWT